MLERGCYRTEEGASPVWQAPAVSLADTGAPVRLRTGGCWRVFLGWKGSLVLGEVCGVKAWLQVDGRRPVALELTEEDGSVGTSIARLR
jgi:hypothetical protein